jgi:NAD(P)-dependent dehydrogenase (short-subunit alcohol dehydrogenase family)
MQQKRGSHNFYKEVSMNRQRFQGETVIITGGGRGIGRATAFRFAREGADVMLVGRTIESLDDTVSTIEREGGKAWYHRADVTKSVQVNGIIHAATKRCERIDVLINNAGIDDDTPFLDIEEKNWDQIIATNLKAPFLLSQKIAREMVKSGSGVSLHNASIDATGGEGNYASYIAAKTGLLGLSRTMALELAAYGIRVNCVSPGYTHTEMTENAVGPGMVQHLLNSFDRVPMRRLVRADEVAAAFAFLASDDASAITGTNLVVDCGTTANWYILETLKESER